MMTVDSLAPGTRVRVVHQIDRRDGPWTAEVSGAVVSVADAPTGSWFAHGHRSRYWLKRVTLRKDDGELTVVSLDQNSRIILLDQQQDEPLR